MSFQVHFKSPRSRRSAYSRKRWQGRVNHSRCKLSNLEVLQVSYRHHRPCRCSVSRCKQWQGCSCIKGRHSTRSLLFSFFFLFPQATPRSSFSSPRHIGSLFYQRILQNAIRGANSLSHRSGSRLVHFYAGDPARDAHLLLPWHYWKMHASMLSERLSRWLLHPHHHRHSSLLVRLFSQNEGRKLDISAPRISYASLRVKSS